MLRRVQDYSRRAGGSAKARRRPLPLLIALLSLSAAGPAHAGPPLEYGKWNVTNGTIGTSCGAGLTCQDIVSGAGYLQRHITGPDNQVYIQSIMTNTNATGANGIITDYRPDNYIMSYESFVQGNLGKHSSATTGIALHHYLATPPTDPAQNSSFNMTTEINRGWASTANQPDIHITQTVIDHQSPLIKSDDATMTFEISGHVTGEKVTSGRTTIKQITGLNNDTSKELQHWQVLQITQVYGDMVSETGSATLPDGQKLEWQVGDTIQTVWVGQTLDPASFNPDTPPVIFGRQSFTNLTLSANQILEILYASQYETGPFAWPDPFGPAPDMTPP